MLNSLKWTFWEFSQRGAIDRQIKIGIHSCVKRWFRYWKNFPTLPMHFRNRKFKNKLNIRAPLLRKLPFHSWLAKLKWIEITMGMEEHGSVEFERIFYEVSFLQSNINWAPWREIRFQSRARCPSPVSFHCHRVCKISWLRKIIFTAKFYWDECSAKLSTFVKLILIWKYV